MGRFLRKFKKGLGSHSVNNILESGRTISSVKESVRQDRVRASKMDYVNNNLDKIPLQYSKELFNMANSQVINNGN